VDDNTTGLEVRIDLCGSCCWLQSASVADVFEVMNGTMICNDMGLAHTAVMKYL